MVSQLGCAQCSPEGGLRAFGGAAAPAVRGDERGGSQDRALTQAAVAEISTMAREIFAQMEESGTTDLSFDLELELTRLGVHLDSRGVRSADGRQVSIDLAIDASRRVVQTEEGTYSVSRLEISYTLEDTRVALREEPPRDVRGEVLPPPAGPPAWLLPPRPAPVLMDSLRALLDFVEARLNGDESSQGLSLANLDAAGGAQLNQLLQQIGRSLEALGTRSAEPGAAAAKFEAYSTEVQVRVQSLLIQDSVDRSRGVAEAA
ncbi:MAG: hypothetical protein FJ033_07080 [Chloroflexi bacterium]|nr:hypothetical protein [Chloroflexota bacterium]